MKSIKSNKTSEYLFTYLDKENNILLEKIIECDSKKHSLKLADSKLLLSWGTSFIAKDFISTPDLLIIFSVFIIRFSKSFESGKILFNFIISASLNDSMLSLGAPQCSHDIPRVRVGFAVLRHLPSRSRRFWGRTFRLRPRLPRWLRRIFRLRRARLGT